MTRQEFIEQVLIHNQFSIQDLTYPIGADMDERTRYYVDSLCDYAILLANAMYGKAEQPQEQDPLDKPIEIIAENARGLRLFSLLGVNSIREFVELQEFNIPAYENLGRKTISHISDNLEYYGYTIWSNSNGKCRIKSCPVREQPTFEIDMHDIL